MKNVLKEFGNVFYSIFEGLPTFEKVILIFWGLCFMAFVIAYVRVLIVVAQHYISISLRKSKPQKF
jgi:hypothetical protein